MAACSLPLVCCTGISPLWALCPAGLSARGAGSSLLPTSDILVICMPRLQTLCRVQQAALLPICHPQAGSMAPWAWSILQPHCRHFVCLSLRCALRRVHRLAAMTVPGGGLPSSRVAQAEWEATCQEVIAGVQGASRGMCRKCTRGTCSSPHLGLGGRCPGPCLLRWVLQSLLCRLLCSASACQLSVCTTSTCTRQHPGLGLMLRLMPAQVGPSACSARRCVGVTVSGSHMWAAPWVMWLVQVEAQLALSSALHQASASSGMLPYLSCCPSSTQCSVYIERAGHILHIALKQESNLAVERFATSGPRWHWDPRPDITFLSP